MADGVLAVAYAVSTILWWQVAEGSGLGDVMYAAPLLSAAMTGLHVASALSNEVTDCQHRKATGLVPQGGPGR